MHEFNDGLRPNYDPYFDEAINLTSKGKSLEVDHEIAINKHINSAQKITPIANNKPIVVTQ